MAGLIVIHLALVIAGVVVTRIVIVRIRIVIDEVRRDGAILRDVVAVVFIIRVVRRPPRIKSDTKDHPRFVDEATPVTVPPMIATSVPVAMPISRMPRDDVPLPVTTEMIVSISEIVSTPEIGPVTELASGISLVPHACGGWISVIRESRETIGLIRLSDGCRSVWTGAGNRHPIRINRWLTKPSRPIRTHCK